MKLLEAAKAYIEHRKNLKYDWIDKTGYVVLVIFIIYIAGA